MSSDCYYYLVWNNTTWQCRQAEGNNFMSGLADKAKELFEDGKDRLNNKDVNVPDSVKDKLPDQVNEFIDGDGKEESQTGPSSQKDNGSVANAASGKEAEKGPHTDKM